MEILTHLSYIPGSMPRQPAPLTRYLPPVLDGLLSTWLDAHSRPGDWVLDPFGAAPRLVAEVARNGRRVLVAANNPVTRFLLEMAAISPQVSDLRSALAELAASRKEGERLENHLLNLYQTECVQCRQVVFAEAFLWERQAEKPYARIYHCQQCGDRGERPATQADVERAARWAATEALHRARALERVTPRDDPDRVHAEEALSNYLPRAVYALGTLINRLDVLSLSPDRRRLLTALLLSTCDQADSLWPYPAERPRPKQLVIPSRFRENNIWMALEAAVAIWSGTEEAVPFHVWPDEPPESGGIAVFEGPLRELAPHLENIPIRTIISALPRPNQAFWTLSALWTGWLWGRDAVAPFKSVLRRRRYDWSWHATALTAAFGNLKSLPEGTPFLGLVGEAEPGYITSVLVSAQASAFELEGLAMRAENDPVLLHWNRASKKEAAPTSIDRTELETSLRKYLELRFEPTTYLHLLTSGLAVLAREKTLPESEESVSQLQAAVQQILTEIGKFIHYEGSENPETGLWGIQQSRISTDYLPFSDRVEMSVVRKLLRQPGCSLREVEADIYKEFPGLLTPSLALLQAVLDSYGERQDDRWSLREEDISATRREDLSSMSSLVNEVGERLGYSVIQDKGPSPILLWKDDDRICYAFYVLASAITGHIVRTNPYPPEKTLVVLPGGRAGLLAYKISRDPFLRQKTAGWRFIKYRHLRLLAETPLLTRETWEAKVASDPIEQRAQQMIMF